MKTRNQNLVGALLIIACLLGAALHTARAQIGDGYDLTWNTQESGGLVEASDGYSLTGSFGQPDASATLNGEGYALVGGFWGGYLGYHLHLPAVQK